MSDAALKLASATNFKIDKNVPLPKPGGGPSGGSKWPLAAMEVGDSFYAEKPRTAINAAVHYHRCSVDPARRFSVRTEGSGFRIWRVA